MNSKLVWKAEDVVRAVQGDAQGGQSWTAHGVSIDSRTAKPNDLFVALVGPSHDAHQHVATAFSSGVSAAIVAKKVEQAPAQASLIYVGDTFKALEALGQAGRARAQSNIIAVTGSVGKTSTKEMLKLMLSAAGSTYANEGSLNNHWGVPLSLARLPADAKYGVFELGMNHAGELSVLTKQVRPHVALITTIEAVHMEFFASVEAIADAKGEIFQGVNAEGTAVLNSDNPQYAQLAAVAKSCGIKKILSFGHDAKADARMLSIHPTPEGCEVRAEIQGKKITYHLSVHGDHLALNSLGALLACSAVGADIQACANALSSYQQPKGRGVVQTITLDGGNIVVIDESYNASPVSVRAAIRVLGQAKTDGRRILVLGDMKELGNSAPALHKGLADAIADARVDKVFCCGDLMKNLYDALPTFTRGAHAKNSEELAPLVASAVQAGDIVSVKGSNSMQMNKVVASLLGLGDKETSKKMAS